MGRDTGKEKKPRQGKSSRIGDVSKSASLEARVAAFLLEKKGDQSLGVFSSKLGLHKETLSRYLDCEQSMTLGTLEKIAKALKVKPSSLLK